MKVLIVEDEQLTAEGLSDLLNKIDSTIVVAGYCQSVKETIHWIKNNEEPDLIFLDIHLADGLSFDIFKNTEVKVPIIFTTAYDKYAIKAFKVNSIDYLLKPIEKKELKQSLDKFKKLQTDQVKINTEDIALIQETINILQKKYKTRFMVKSRDQLKSLKSEEIAYFIVEDGVVLLITKDKLKFHINYSLDQLETILDPLLFFRINRKLIININQIEKVNSYFNNRLKLAISPDPSVEVIVSRERVQAFKDWLDE